MKLSGEDKAGLYITVIVHLTVIIIFLLFQISNAISKETSFVIDFSKQEEIERLQEELKKKEEISKRIDRLIAEQGVASSQDIRNTVVDRSSLKDDRGTNAEELYKEADRLQNELKRGQNQGNDEETIDISKPDDKKVKSTENSYKGPSVVSYLLDGRKASLLKIPAYRCMGSGEVTVIITVDNKGNVINAKVQDDISSTDSCLRDFAVRAARASKFSASTTAPARQTGNIVYAFVAQ